MPDTSLIEKKETTREDLYLRKSNDIISAKYKSSLLENQIAALAMTRIEIVDNQVLARIYPGELMSLIDKGRHIYNELRMAAKSIVGHTIVIEDGQGNFKVFALIPKAEYKDGVFTIYFNEEIKQHIYGLKNNYTTLSLSVLSMFKKNSSFRMYELLKKELYKSNRYINNGAVVVTYGVNELKYMIGLANADETKVQNYIRKNQKNIDWDYIYENLAIEKTYPEWRDFQRRVLKPAQKELEEKSDLRFEYKGIRLGGPTYKKIEFTIYPNIPGEDMQKLINNKKQIIRRNKKDCFEQPKANHQITVFEMGHDELFSELRGHNRLTDEDISLLLDKAYGDEDKVRRAVELADKQESIDNYMGWLIRCIERGFDQTPVMKGSDELAEVVADIRIDMENHKVENAKKMWDRKKGTEDFKEFVAFIESKGFIFSQYEIFYEVTERVQHYCDWRTGREVNIV